MPPQVAIVGIGSKTPRGNGLKDLWQALTEHDSLIRTICIGEEPGQAFGHASILHPDVRAGFDASFWGMTPSQAADLDPQTRWILDGTWNAILDSRGLTLDGLSKLTVGTYCGIMNNDIAQVRDAANMDFSLNATSGSVAGFISHAFGFRGPSLDVNTMCSSGLVCLELAKQALESGSIDVAVVAAANWTGGEASFRKIGSVNALSPDGIQDCLGSTPNGYVRGEGMVTLLLQRTKDVNSGGIIRGIIEAIASSHHGSGARSRTDVISTNVALPSSASYIGSYEKCFLNPRISKDDVVYLEMHATGTIRGDKAEVDSVREFYGDGREKAESTGIAGEGNISKTLWLGGNKSIFGHTEPVSGLLSIAKLLLAFEKHVMPPTLFMTDHSIDVENMRSSHNIDIVLTPLPLDKLCPGLFALTASGMSGTTTHVVIRPPSKHDLRLAASNKIDKRPWPLMLSISTHSFPSCKCWQGEFASNLLETSTSLTTDLIVPQGSFPRARAAIAALTTVSFDGSPLSSTALMGERVTRNPPPVLIPPGEEEGRHDPAAGLILAFGGVGLVQYGCARRTYQRWPSFREQVDLLDALFGNAKNPLFHGRSVAHLCGMTTGPCTCHDEPLCPNKKETAKIGAELPTKIMQPATFIVQYAQAAALLKDFNVKPEAVLGHSFGEIVAAVVSGAITITAGVEMTLARTQACLDLEATMNEPMAMILCNQISEETMKRALDTSGMTASVFLSGIIAEDECLLSGTRAAMEQFQAWLIAQVSNEITFTWVESTVAFHSPLVNTIGNAVKQVIEDLIRDGLFFDASQVVSSKLFMTSIGSQVAGIERLRVSSFWENSINHPILLKGVLESLEHCYGNGPQPLIDLSPRGLYVNWFKRHGGDHFSGLSLKVVSAPVFSFDFVRVLQNCRHLRDGDTARKLASQLKPKMLPPYPFLKQIVDKISLAHHVRAIERPDRVVTSVYHHKMCFETHFKRIEVHSPSTFGHDTCIGINLVGNGSHLWGALWGTDNAQHNIMDEFDNAESFCNDPFWTGIQKVCLVIMGPVRGTSPLSGFDDPLCMDRAVEFVVAVQDLLVRDDSPLNGIVLVSEDATNPAFEFIAGSFATLRLQLPNLSFVSLLRLEIEFAESTHCMFDQPLTQKILDAAALGETVMQLSAKDGLKGLRVLPMSTILKSDAKWVQSNCLYVVSGSTSGIASTLLPYLASLGLRHFLLLVNRRQPSKELIGGLYRLGALTVHMEACQIMEEYSIQLAVKKGLAASGVERVAGVFHLACIDDEIVSLPIPVGRIKKVLNVKYAAHRALLGAIDLQEGDIFSVPGSISTIMGSGGIAYAATNHACRALQLRVAPKLISPYPVMGVSHTALRTSTLANNTWHITSAHQMAAKTGVLPSSSQAFNLGQTSPLTTPTTGKDLIFCRFNVPVLNDYLNSTSSNLLFSDLVAIEEEDIMKDLEEIVSLHSSKAVSPSLKKPTKQFENAEDALISCIAHITGFSTGEVRQATSADAFLDEAFGIDSISSVRLSRHIEQLGYNIIKDTIASSSYGTVLEQMKSSHDAATATAPIKNEATMGITSKETAADDNNQNTSIFGIELTGEQLPVSKALMEVAGYGHNTAAGGILPSLWYAMVGCLVLRKNIKMVLHRMSELDVASASVMKHTDGDRTTLTFLTALPEKDPLVRAQVTSTNERLSVVPLLTEQLASPHFVAEGVEEIYMRFMRLSGFRYEAAYQSLQKVEVFGQVDISNENNFLVDCHVLAEGHVTITSKDPSIAKAIAFFVLADAGLQTMVVAVGATFAPAKLIFEAHIPIQDWPSFLTTTKGSFSVSTRFIGTDSSHLEAISTVYIDRMPIYTGRCVLKGLPIPVGSRLFPQFFCKQPRHTLICFHEAGGTSRIYDPLGQMMAEYGVRVLCVDFPQHGRRSQQTDDDIITTLGELKKDLMPWIRHEVQGPDGLVPFTIFGVSSGGVCAYGLVRDMLLPEGLAPRAMITLMSQPPNLRNQHVERTYQATAENIGNFLSYFSVLGGVDLTFLNEGQVTADRCRSVLGIVHEITADGEESPPKVIDVPTYIFGIQNDPVVPWSVVSHWRKVLGSKTTFRMLGGELNHFMGLTGDGEKAFRQIFFEHSVLSELIPSVGR